MVPSACPRPAPLPPARLPRHWYRWRHRYRWRRVSWLSSTVLDLATNFLNRNAPWSNRSLENRKNHSESAARPPRPGSPDGPSPETGGRTKAGAASA